MKYAVNIFITLFCINLSQAQKDLSAYIFVAEECPISIFMVNDLIKLAEDYGADCNFVLVFPMKKSTSETALSFLKEHGLDQFTIELDTLQEIAKKYEAKVTPEIVIEKNSSNTVLYRGRINDAYFAPGRKRHTPLQRDAASAFANILSHKTVPKPWETAIGCFITFH